MANKTQRSTRPIKERSNHTVPNYIKRNEEPIKITFPEYSEENPIEYKHQPVEIIDDPEENEEPEELENSEEPIQKLDDKFWLFVIDGEERNLVHTALYEDEIKIKMLDMIIAGTKISDMRLFKLMDLEVGVLIKG